MAFAAELAYVPSRDYSNPARPAKATGGLWACISTYGLLLVLIYFALDGVSPFVNVPVATRVVATTSDATADRVVKLTVFLFCMAFTLKSWPAVRALSLQTKLITAYPILAILLCPLSQSATRTISCACLLGAGTLLLYYMMSRFKPNEILEIFLVVGLITVGSSIPFSLLLPQFGLDQLGGHANAWKGVFSAKNYLGNIALFFLTVAVSYRPRTLFFSGLRWAQIGVCLVAIAFSRAATAYLITAIYLIFLFMVNALQGLRKKDYLFVCFCAFIALSVAATVVMIWPESVIYLLGKEPTLTGRTQLWAAVEHSIAKQPLLGYGYQAFWLGLKGESYYVILTVTWLMGQAQNGYFDILLENGFFGFGILMLVFGFAYRDGVGCLLRSRDKQQLRTVEWYLAIVLLTTIYNLSESFLFDPSHLGSMMFLLACIGLKAEWVKLRNA